MNHKIINAGLVLLFLMMSNAYALPEMYVTIMSPASVTVPGHINTLALIDRSQSADSKSDLKEGIITGEIPQQDAQASKSALDGLVEALSNSPRYVVKQTGIKMLTNAGGSIFPDPLTWDEVDRICKEQNVDAVLALEIFDSDFKTIPGMRKIEGSGPAFLNTEFYVNATGTVKLGFRMYDKLTHTVIDQQTYSRSLEWSSTGKTPVQAAAGLLNRTEAIKQVGYSAAAYYAERISPEWITVTRYYYKKPKKNNDFVVGVRQIEVGQWEEGLESFLKATNDRNNKTAGRAAYNAALSYEVLGELEKALQYAQESYTKYGNKKAMYYVNTLNRRIEDWNVLKEQLGEE
jgi:tetratricopeptide (TPR) repeat protein